MSGDVKMADTNQSKQPGIKTETKIGNTTYITCGYFAPKGPTISEKIKRLLDKEIKGEMYFKIETFLDF